MDLLPLVVFSLVVVSYLLLLCREPRVKRPRSISYGELLRELERRTWQGFRPEDPEYLRQLTLDLIIAEESLERAVNAQEKETRQKQDAVATR
jgi:hypothetical protein